MSLVGLFLVMLSLSGGSTTAALQGSDSDVVAFVSNRVVDLAWDPVSCDHYEVTRNSGTAGCTPIAEPGVGRILCHDEGLAAGESYSLSPSARLSAMVLHPSPGILSPA